MNTKKQHFVAVVLFLALSLTCILGNLGALQVKATGPVRNTVYYFSDSTDPLISASSLAANFTNYSQRIYTNDSLASIINSIPATGGMDLLFDSTAYAQISSGGTLPDADEGGDCIAVFELIYVIPDPSSMHALFSELKQSGYKIMVIGSFTAEDFFDTQFLQYVDTLYTYYPEQYFVDWAMYDILVNQDGLEPSTLILEDRFLAGDTVPNSFYEAYTRSWFLRNLIQKIRELYPELYSSDDDIDQETDEAIFPDNTLQIMEQLGINIQWFKSGNLYQLSREISTVDISDIDEYYTASAHPMYAFGYTSLSTLCYQFFWDVQHDELDNDRLKVYLIQDCPVQNDPDGLQVSLYNRTTQNEATARSEDSGEALLLLLQLKGSTAEE